MDFNDKINYYDALDVSPNATLHEIKEAYAHFLKTFNRENLATYALLSAQEREALIKKVEEAYHVLSNAEKRREYDANIYSFPEQSLTEPTPDLFLPVSSIDRVPPMDMDSAQGIEQLLVPPDTSIEHESRYYPDPVMVLPFRPMEVLPSSGRIKKGFFSHTGFHRKLPEAILVRLKNGEEISGLFLKEVRESIYVSLEELSFDTKISRRYLLAIEEEAYDRLPASVYVRGFVTQIAKHLSLPIDEVVHGYMRRCFENRQPKR